MACTETTTTYNRCTPNTCTDNIDCECKVLLSTDCITYTGDDLPCSGIKKNTIETNMWQQMDAFICRKFTEFTGTLSLISTGIGAKIYKGIDPAFGYKQIRSLTKTGNLITVTENINDIGISINETNLSAFVKSNQNNAPDIEFPTPIVPPVYTNQSVGAGAEVLKGTVGTTSSFRELVLKNDTVASINTPVSSANIIKEIVVNGDNIDITQSAIQTSTLVLEKLNGAIKINTPNYVSTDGSVLITATSGRLDFKINTVWLQNNICALLDNCPKTVVPMAYNDVSGITIQTNNTYTLLPLSNDVLGTPPTNITSVGAISPVANGLSISIAPNGQSIRLAVDGAYSYNGGANVYSFPYTITDSNGLTSSAVFIFEDIA